MNPHLVSTVVALVIAVVLGAERAFRWFRPEGGLHASPSATCPIGSDPEIRALLLGHNMAIDKISAVLSELRADHRVQDNRLNDIHNDLMSLR